MKAVLFALSAGSLLGSVLGLHDRHLAFHRRSDSVPAAPVGTGLPSYPPQWGWCKSITTVTIDESAAPHPTVPTPHLSVLPTPGTYALPTSPSTVVLGHDTTVTQQTTYLATPGTHTIGDSTYVASTSTVIVYPVPATYAAGTYTQPVVTVTAVVTSQVFAFPYDNVGDVTVKYTSKVTAVASVYAPMGSDVAYPAAAAPPAYSAPPAAPAPAPAPGIAANGNKWAMTYTPYSTTGQCKSASDVLADVAAIAAKGFPTIRMYGTDCNGLQNVGAAAKASGIKLIIGIFIDGNGIEAARPQIQQIVSWGQTDGNFGSVVLLVVGNECISNRVCDPGALAAFIRDAKSAVSAAGGSFPVTTTEPLDKIIANKDVLCPVIDVAAANLQAYFNGGVVAANAGDFIASELQILSQQCPGKPYYNLESGWPSGGVNNGASIASPDAQRAAIADIVAKAGDHSVIFSFQDDAWKVPGPLAVEQHFGCLDLF